MNEKIISILVCIKLVETFWILFRNTIQPANKKSVIKRLIILPVLKSEKSLNVNPLEEYL
jgi:hypothetical protein